MGLLKTPAATVAFVLLVSSACTKEQPPPGEPPMPPPPLAQPASPPPAPVAVASLELGRAIGPDKRVMSAMSEFGTRDTIYVSVATTGASAGTPMTAKWTYHGSERETVTVDSTTRSIAPSGPAVTEFRILNPSAWPTGRYKVAILLNGTPAMEKEFEVKK